MKNLLLIFFALTFTVYAAAEKTDDETVEGVAANETAIFYGETADGKSLVAVSAPKTPDDNGGYIAFYYRHADGAKTELRIPTDAENPARYHIEGLSGEQFASVRFPDGDTEYVVYSGEDPFAWVNDEPAAYAGLVVRKNGEVIERLAFTEYDFDFMAETFQQIGLTIDDEAAAAANPHNNERVEHSFDWRVRAAFPKTGAAAVDEQTSAFIKDFLAQQLAASSTGEIFAPYNATLTVAGKLTRPSDRAVSVVLLMDNYEQSAAHPLHLTRVLNYELPSGAALPFNKIFGKPEKALAIFAARAPALALEELKKISLGGGNLSKQDEDDLRKMMTGFQDGFAATAENYAAVGLEPAGVRLYFQEYQIAPYAFGMPTVLIPLADLADAEPNLELWGNAP